MFNLKQIVSALRIPSQDEMEKNYLDEAVDGYDLEYRIRQIDGGLFKRAI